MKVRQNKVLSKEVNVTCVSLIYIVDMLIILSMRVLLPALLTSPAFRQSGVGMHPSKIFSGPGLWAETKEQLRHRC